MLNELTGMGAGIERLHALLGLAGTGAGPATPASYVSHMKLLRYDELEGTPDDDLEYFLRSDVGAEPSECRFFEQTLTLKELAQAGMVTGSPEDYLADDNEDAYEQTLTLADIYESGGPEALPPIVLWHDGTMWRHLDGYKRMCAAGHLGMESLPAYILVLDQN